MPDEQPKGPTRLLEILTAQREGRPTRECFELMILEVGNVRRCPKCGCKERIDQPMTPLEIAAGALLAALLGGVKEDQ